MSTSPNKFYQSYDFAQKWACKTTLTLCSLNKKTQKATFNKLYNSD